MVNFSIAVAVLLASPTQNNAFQLPQRRRHHNIIVHHSSRGDYNNYRDEYERERGGAPRGEYGFDRWDDDPINRKNGYDGYDWQFQRENDNGDINDMKCVNTVHLLYHDDQVIMSCVLIRSVLLFFISFALVTDKIPIPHREMNSADLSNINKTINHLVMTGEITD